MTILVTGGAGYIGSFMTRALLDDGYEVVVVDSLTTGSKDVVDQRAEFEQADVGNNDAISSILEKHKIDAVIHFAAFISMGESMQKPEKYFEGNTIATYNLIKTLIKHSIKKFIFSSTAGVYGEPQQTPIPESHRTVPGNPYGESKLMVERILHWMHDAHGMNYAALRYFNASGASLDGQYGENHDPETHLIPNAINATLKKEKFNLFGDDYDTPDGTCVRDYIHVLDLVHAHLLALNKLDSDPGEYTYNVGTGKGYSNREVLDMIAEVSGMDLEIDIKPRRPGDAATLVADPTKINEELGFKPKHSDLKTVITSAWKWHSRNKKA